VTATATPGTATTGARRGRPRSEAIDAAILDATVDEIIDVGFFAISMESVAVRAGVAKTTVYRRFPDATELGVEALRRLKGPAEEPPRGDAREQLVVLAQRLRRTWSNQRFAAAMRRAVAEGTRQPDLFRDCRDRLVGPHLLLMNAAIERAKDEGLIRSDVDTALVRRLIIGPVLAAAFTLQRLPTAEDVERGVDVVLGGLAP
jgi:AcrR family transcriptional regulator